ncbi:hypothetical protein GOE03_30755 [Sinorhizobium medicae]|nr:hypothetical protein [Sinorhizobium medicae]
MRPALEVAEVFRRHGPAYRRTHDGHLGRGERRVMAAIELCRTAALGGHVETCEDCALSRVAYNSCRNRHCPKCQGAARERWLADRRLFLERLLAAQAAVGLRFFGALEPLGDGNALAQALRPLRKKRWVVYAKHPFGSPERVLAYLGRYTHRVAIANSRLVSADDSGVTFRWRDYRHGNAPRSMTLAPHQFIRRFLLHCLPDGFHRIRHYGFLANGIRRARLATIIRRLLADAPPQQGQSPGHQRAPFDPAVCPCCGGILRITARLPRVRPWPDTS